MISTWWLQVLKLAQSTYHPAYTRLADEVEKARTQANDNVTFLAPLRPRLEKLLYRRAPHRSTRLTTACVLNAPRVWLATAHSATVCDKEAVCMWTSWPLRCVREAAAQLVHCCAALLAPMDIAMQQ
jgi:Dynein heavy chain, N-terminal region 1